MFSGYRVYMDTDCNGDPAKVDEHVDFKTLEAAYRWYDAQSNYRELDRAIYHGDKRIHPVKDVTADMSPVGAAIFNCFRPSDPKERTKAWEKL